MLWQWAYTPGAQEIGRGGTIALEILITYGTEFENVTYDEQQNEEKKYGSQRSG